MTSAQRSTGLLLIILSLFYQGCGDQIAGKRAELCRFVPDRTALDASRQVEGKVAIVYKGALYDPKFDHGCALDGYSGGRSATQYLPDEMYARSTEELDTLIVIELSKGDHVKSAQYSMTKSSRTVEVYSGRLRISLIDYKASTLVRSLVRNLRTVPRDIPADKLNKKPTTDTNSEYVIEPTTDEIRTALRELFPNTEGDKK